MKRIRDTERPPAPPRELEPVWVAHSGKVHLAKRRAPPFFVSDQTLCGRHVEGLPAVSDRRPDCTCAKCGALAKQTA